MNTEAKVVVSNQPALNRYELRTGGELAAFLDYRTSAGQLDLVHTEVDPRFEGQGLGAKLVQGALDDARASGHKVVPSCSFVAKFVQRHAGYQDLVAARD